MISENFFRSYKELDIFRIFLRIIVTGRKAADSKKYVTEKFSVTLVEKNMFVF